VVLAQRFGGALNLNLHFHVLVIDGTYSGHATNPLVPPTFHEAAPLTDQDVAEVVVRLRRRIVKYLRRCGRIPRDEHDESAQPEPDEPLFAELCAASVQGRVALGPNSGAAVERFGRGNGDQRPRSMPGELCCDVDGFSLQAKVRIEADDREGLERVCRYVTRPPIRLESLSLAPDGKVIYAMRRRWRDGTSLNRVRAARLPGQARGARPSTEGAFADVSRSAGSGGQVARVHRGAVSEFGGRRSGRFARRAASATEL